MSTYRQALTQLRDVQKSKFGSPAYSVLVNRRLGRFLAAFAASLRLTPNAVTVISAVCSYVGIVGIALVGPPAVSVLAPFLLVLGYALDSADGQLARLRGRTSVAGEWLDHMLDAVKIVSLHLAVLIHFYRFTDLSVEWGLVPIGFAVVAVALFFAQILNEQLRAGHSHSGTPRVPRSTGQNLLRSIVKLPHDYGILCWSFVLLDWPSVFAWVYLFLFATNAAYLGLASVKWFRDMNALDNGAER